MFDLLICWQPHSHCAHNLKTNLKCIFVSLIHSSHHFFLYCASRRCSWLLRCAISRHIFRVQEINQFYLRKRGESFFFQCPGNRHCRRCRLNCSFLINTQSARRNTQKRLEIVCFWFDEYQFLYHIIWTLLCRMHAGFYSELFAVVLQQCGCESTEVAWWRITPLWSCQNRCWRSSKCPPLPTHTVFHCIFLFYCHRFTRGYWYGSFDVCARARFVFRLTHFLDANLFFFAFHFIPFVSCAQMRARAHRCMFALHTFTFVRRAQIHGKTKRNTEYNESNAKKWHGAKPRGTQHTAQG